MHCISLGFDRRSAVNGDDSGENTCHVVAVAAASPTKGRLAGLYPVPGRRRGLSVEALPIAAPMVSDAGNNCPYNKTAFLSVKINFICDFENGV